MAKKPDPKEALLLALYTEYNRDAGDYRRATAGLLAMNTKHLHLIRKGVIAARFPRSFFRYTTSPTYRSIACLTKAAVPSPPAPSMLAVNAASSVYMRPRLKRMGGVQS